MEFHVKTRKIGPQQVVALQREVYVKDLPAFISDAFGRLFRYVGSQGGKVAGHGMVIYHGQVNEDSNGPVEVCLPIEAGSIEPADEIRLANFPAHSEAYTTITMAQCVFPEILKAYDAVYAWIEQGPHQMDGAPREVYFADPKRVGPNDPFCDIAWPYR